MFQRLRLCYANTVVRTITRTPIAVLEPNNQDRPYVGSEAHGRLVKATGDRDWIPNFKELEELMSKARQSSGPSSSVAKTSKTVLMSVRRPTVG